jgi:hypothetical protein
MAGDSIGSPPTGGSPTDKSATQLAHLKPSRADSNAHTVGLEQAEPVACNARRILRGEDSNMKAD